MASRKWSGRSDGPGSGAVVSSGSTSCRRRNRSSSGVFFGSLSYVASSASACARVRAIRAAVAAVPASTAENTPRRHAVSSPHPLRTMPNPAAVVTSSA